MSHDRCGCTIHCTLGVDLVVKRVQCKEKIGVVGRIRMKITTACQKHESTLGLVSTLVVYASLEYQNRVYNVHVFYKVKPESLV